MYCSQLSNKRIEMGRIVLLFAVLALIPSLDAAPCTFENRGKDAMVVADHWKEIIAGFRPFNFILYDLLVDEETRFTGVPINDKVGGSLAIVRKIIADGVEAADDLTQVEPIFSPVFLRVMSDNFATFHRLLKNEGNEARLERWLTTLRMSDVASFDRIRSIVVDQGVNKTFEELRATIISDGDDSFFPIDMFHVIVECLDSFIKVLQDPSLVSSNVEERLVDPRFVGPVARYLLHEMAGDAEENRQSILTHLMSDGQCKASELREQADHLMALVNTGILLEGTLINKNIIPHSVQVQSARKEMELHYRQAREIVDELASHCPKQ